MKNVINVTVDFGGERVRGIVLAMFNIDDYDFVIKRGIFGCKKEILDLQPRDCVLIFIPGKHKMKQLAIVRRENICPPIVPPDDWMTVDKFMSAFVIEEAGYRKEIEVRRFEGFDFIYQNKNFIADVEYDNYDAALDILYREMPWLLNEETGGD